MREIAIIGVGIMGSEHARYLNRAVPGARVAAVSDLDLVRARTIADEVGAAVLDDPYDMIVSGAFDGIIIASPDRTHPDLATACLDAGVPALVEKPLATNPADAGRVVEAQGDRQLLSLGFMRRFDPHHVALAEAVAAGTVGRPVLFRSVHRNAAPPPGVTTRQVVTASAIHDIDAARWLLGEFTAVRAVGASTSDGSALDMVLIEGRHASGALSSIEVFVSAAYGYEVTGELIGTKGTVTTLGNDVAVTRVNGVVGTTLPRLWLGRFEAAYIAELRAWVSSLGGGPRFRGASARDGLIDQLVAEAVLEALESAATVVVDV
jgi:myo-inositol 2-dehydrogenase/D-chiro-inositol 1-dehydrogenase